MSESFFPRSIVLALQCPTIQFSPSAWPTNVRAVVRWDEMSESVGLFLSLISRGLAIFDTKIIKTRTLGEPGKSNGHNSIDAEPMQVLTRREMEVASEVYRGATNSIIAERLGIKVINQIVTYFVLRGSTVYDIYTSNSKATTPLQFKGAFNRGNTSSGASRMGGVAIHTETEIDNFKVNTTFFNERILCF